ncbi:hypothetical protein C8R47DRAFT_936143, partial [Mycena vitilis]
PPKDTPEWICSWIRFKCVTTIINGELVPRSKQVSTYTHAQKMRAAMTYAFGCIHPLGCWQENSACLNPTLGNPSVSEVVTSYMIELRRRQVR